MRLKYLIISINLGLLLSVFAPNAASLATNEKNLFSQNNLKLYFYYPSSWTLQFQNQDLTLANITSTQIIGQFVLPKPKSTFRNNLSLAIAPINNQSFTQFKKIYPPEYQESMRKFFDDFIIESEKETSSNHKNGYTINGIFSHENSKIKLTSEIIFEKNLYYSFKLACEESDCENYQDDFQALISTFNHEPPKIPPAAPPKIKRKTPLPTSDKSQDQKNPKIKRKILTSSGQTTETNQTEIKGPKQNPESNQTENQFKPGPISNNKVAILSKIITYIQNHFTLVTISIGILLTLGIGLLIRAIIRTKSASSINREITSQTDKLSPQSFEVVKAQSMPQSNQTQLTPGLPEAPKTQLPWPKEEKEP